MKIISKWKGKFLIPFISCLLLSSFLSAQESQRVRRNKEIRGVVYDEKKELRGLEQDKKLFETKVSSAQYSFVDELLNKGLGDRIVKDLNTKPKKKSKFKLFLEKIKRILWRM